MEIKYDDDDNDDGVPVCAQT